ncbi:MAG: hypothetical protein AAF871_09630 [Pseudomonadota bacterium]
MSKNLIALMALGVMTVLGACAQQEEPVVIEEPIMMDDKPMSKF